MKHSLPARKGARIASHLRALPYSDVPALLKDVEKQDAIWAACMRVTILTVARTKELTTHRWSDGDLAAHTRGVQILKGGKAWRHLVPPSDQAIDLVRGLMVDGKPVGEYVFPARNRRGHLGKSAVLDPIFHWSCMDTNRTHNA